jgi:hypothetical protein
MTKIMLSIVLLCILCLATFATVPGALAEYYKYTDKRGVTSITNKLDAVPAKYRSAMKVIRDDFLTKNDPGAQKQVLQSEPEETATPKQAIAPAPAAAPAGKFAELSARFVWFKPLVYLGGFLSLFVVVIKLTTVIPSPLLSKLIYLAFFLGVFTFIYQAYAEHVVGSSRNIKEKAASIIKKSTAREEAVTSEQK